MVDDLEPEVGISLHEGRPDVRDVVAPAPTVLAVHVVLPLVVLEPIELVEPVGPEAAPFAGRRGSGSAAGSSAICCRFRGLTGRDRRSRLHRRPEDLLQEGFFGGSGTGGTGSSGRSHRIGTGRSTGLTLLLLLLVLESVPVGELAGTGRGRVGDDRNCTLGQLELVLTGSRRLELFGQGRKEGLLALVLLLLLLEQVLVERFLLDGSCGGRGQG